MTGNDFRALGVFHQLHHLSAYIAVRRTVCAVSSYLILLIHIVRNSVHIRFLGHSLMECGIKYQNLRDFRHSIKTALDTHYSGRSVQGRISNAFVENFHNLVTQKHGLGNIGSAVNNSVTDSFDFIN